MASPQLSFLFCILILTPICVVSQTRSNTSVGDSIQAEVSNSQWLISPSGDFAFGFLPLENNNNLFLLSIWYPKIRSKTIVWYANGDTPAPKGSQVELKADGLVLTSPSGGLLWSQNLTSSVSRGVLKDTGNFVLEDGNGTFNSVYETFKDPRDTLLPSQIIEKGIVGKLSSRLRETNFTEGRFQLLFQDDGNLVMQYVTLPSGYVNGKYYESQTVESNTSSPGRQLVFDTSGDVYILRKNNDRFNLSGENSVVSAKQYYLRATLNFDGVFTLFQYPKTGGTAWSPVWSLPDNICTKITFDTGSGVCGYNRPSCECPKGYSLLDANDPYGSCQPDFIQGCKEDELSKGNEYDLYDFEVLIDTDWPLSDYVLQKPFTEEKCRQSCLDDCMCGVAIFRLGDSCWKKKLPLSNGRVDANLDGAKAFIKVRKDNSSISGPPVIVKKNRHTLIVVLSVILSSSAFINFILIGAICLSLSFISMYKKKLTRVRRSDYAPETNLRCFTYEEIEEATNKFDKELGRGAFGVVYEGVINMGSATLVAVKKLNNFLLQEVDKEFRNELKIIALTHHKNLVRLIGFCESEKERLLVYEHMSNGTLASLLFHNGEKPGWKLRLQIAFGIARGLLYLHEECSTQIIHCDIKPQNILLDDYYNARISDFGLAKLLNMNQSRTNTAIRGTKGYVALEWFKNIPISAKVDVYSYGVLLLEIICCRRNVEMEAEDDEKAILTDWAYDCYMQGNLGALVVEDNEALEDKNNFKRLVMIAIWCVQEDPSLRPAMKNVTQMLDGVIEVPVPPCPSPFSIQYQIESNQVSRVLN